MRIDRFSDDIYHWYVSESDPDDEHTQEGGHFDRLEQKADNMSARDHGD